MVAPKKWREIFPRLTPAFLHRGDGGKVLWSLMAIQDAFLERAYQGLNARFPRALDPGASGMLGQDRLITRGREESAEHYAARLRRWRQERRLQASPWALLRQVQEYFREADGTGWEMYVITAVRAKWHLAADGTESVSYGNTWAWGEAYASDTWARWWLVIKPRAGQVSATPAFGDPALYGGELYSDDYAVGHVGISARDAKAIRDIVTVWGAGGVRAVQAVISLDGSDPVPQGEASPNDWADHSTLTGSPPNVSRVPRADRTSFRFWILHPDEGFGDPSVEYFDGSGYYTGDVYTPAGAYTPDGSTWPVGSITLPGGDAYTGDGRAWNPTKIRPVDDGDIPV